MFPLLNSIPLGRITMAAAVCAGCLAAPASAQRSPGIEILPDSIEAILEPIEGNSDTYRIRVDDGDKERTIQISVGSDHGDDGIVRFGEDIVINEGEFVDGDVVSMGGDIINNGRISGDCVSIGGNISLGLDSSSDGDVVCIGGTLEIGDGARVDGDAVSVWGRMNRSEMADVRGEIVEVGTFAAGFSGVPLLLPGFGGGVLHDVWGLLRRLVWVFILALIGIVLFQVFPSRMGRLADIAGEDGGKAFLVGLAGWILWLPAFVALVITIIGVPVALLFIFLTPLMVLFGYLGVAVAVGKRFRGRFGSAGTKQALLVGLLALEGGVVLAQLLRVGGLSFSVFNVLAGVVGLIGYMIIFIAGTVGFGAIILSRFRPRESHHEESAPSEAPGGGAQPAFGSGSTL